MGRPEGTADNTPGWVHALVLLMAWACLTGLYWGYQGELLVDRGKEYYLAQHIAQHGLVLYRDMYLPYPPLAYLLCALWVKVFGDSVASLMLFGSGWVLGIVGVCRGIFSQLTRCPRLASGWALALLLFWGASTYVTTNMMMPYSYAMPVALCFALLSVWLLLRALHSQNHGWWRLASVAYGASLAAKPDFALVGLVLLWFLWKRRLGWKESLYGVLGLLLPLIAAYGALVLQGASVDDLYRWANQTVQLALSPQQNRFYAHYGLVVSPSQWPRYLVSLGYLLLGVVPLLLGFQHLLAHYSQAKTLPQKGVSLLGVAVLFMSLGFVVANGVANNTALWALPVVLLLLCAVLMVPWMVKEAGVSWAQAPPAEAAAALVAMAMLCCVVRSPFSLNLSIYGSYYGVLYLVLFVACLVPLERWIAERSPQGLWAWRTKAVSLQAASLLVVLLLAVAVQGIYYKSAQSIAPYWVRTPKGEVRALATQGPAVQQTIDFLGALKPKPTSLMVLFEGAGLNYWLDVPLSTPFYTGYPSYLAVYGGDRGMAKSLAQAPPQWLVISNQRFDEFGGKHFLTIAPAVHQFIRTHYRHVRRFGNEPGLVLTLYRRTDPSKATAR